MATPNDLSKTALQHLGVIDAVETPSGEDAQLCLDRLKSLLDALQLDPQAVIGRQELTRTPAAGVQSFTIGTGGDISSVKMPASIDAAFYRISGTDTPVGIKPLDVYLAEASKTTRGQPDYIAYERSYGVGTVYIYPASDGTAELHMWVRRDVVSGYDSLTLTTSLTLPNGYQNLLEWCLADEVAPSYPQAPGIALVHNKAAIAMRRVKRANVRINEMRMPLGISTGKPFNIYEG